MKITKRKWGKEPPLFFYRDVESGKLITQGDRWRDCTDTLFKEKRVENVFERSLQSCLLKASDKDGNKSERNEITEIVSCLCKNINLRKSVNKIKSLSPQEAEKKCNETLSGYGKGFAAAGSKMTLYDALLTLIKGNDEQKAMAETELKKIQEALLKEKEYRINRVHYSIKGNKIPLLIKDDGSITANNERAAWLLELLKPVRPIPPGHKAGCYPVLDEMERIFSFKKLSHEIHEQVTKCDGGTRSIAKAVDEKLRKYLQELWENHPEHHRDMKYYFQAVREYFKENFPIRTKREGARKRQELLKSKDALSRLPEPKRIANAVRRKLINQSTQMNILYGKLYEYCCKVDDKLPVNSETLQHIQVLEAVKKQVMTAVLWSISRLCYFYQHYNSEIKDDDILSDKQKVIDYRKKFLVCNKKYSDEDVQACKEKLQDFFPLEKMRGEYCKDTVETCKDINEIFRDDRIMCNKLLEECIFYVRSLRLKIFHYKNLSFSQTLKRIADEVVLGDKNVLLHLYKLDRKNLNKAFAQKISSMNLSLYYRKDFLSHIFTKHDVEFSLYSANYQMTPSFRRVYERGKNLGLKWFKQLNVTIGTTEDNTKAISNTDAENDVITGINVDTEADIDHYIDSDTENETDTNTNAQRVVRNLLQLIYKHHFLPEARKDATLVTSKISKVLDRNKRIAEERNQSEEARNFGYRVIGELYNDDMTLAELLKELQRKISETEKENQELAQEKTDYAQRFIREVFAEAFNSFMQNRYGEEYDEIMRPQKNDEEAEKWIEDNNSVNLASTFDENKIEEYLLVFYPVMRLLDGKELSELQQQMLRFRASMSKWQGETDFSEDIEMIEKIEEMAELVKLTEPIPIYAEESWRKRAEEEFKHFFEGDLKDYGTFYLHSDGSSPVLRRNMTKLLRSGVLGVYRQLLHNRKQATKSDYNTYCERQWVMGDSDERWITFAEHAQRVLQQLHSKYAVSPSRFSEDDHKLYSNILQWLEDYNQAKRNLTFETLYGLCSINMEILSRWVGFVQDWERDMYFLLLAWAKQGKLYEIKEEDIISIFAEGRVAGNINKKLKGGNMDTFMSIYRLENGKEMDFMKVRNGVAHLDLLRSSNWIVDENQDCSVMEDYLNRLRILLSYDQKRMNAVTKAMQKLFEKHKTRVEFMMEEGGKLKFKRMLPDHIEHLKKSRFKKQIPVEIPSHGETFLSNLEELMKYPR